MKNIFFSLALMLIGSFAYANTVVTQKAETIEVVSEKFVTYEINNPLMGELTISVPENALNNKALCGFPVFFDDGGSGSWGGSGSFWFDCSGGATMSDIVDFLLSLFF